MRWSTADSSVGAKPTQTASAGDRPAERGDRADEGAVGQEHEAEVLLRGADGGEHAQLPEPSLGDDREAGGGDQRGQEEEDGGDGEHRQRVCPLRVGDRVSVPREGRTGRWACESMKASTDAGSRRPAR